MRRPSISAIRRFSTRLFVADDLPCSVFWQHARGRKFLRKRTRRCLRYLPAANEHLDS